ncbi:phage head closure protein [Asticcacaulis sp.]|uniref:phage head closure protein n=1 Tax=Asticcacaulis sp. TaxID=1872648 RepID=UPI003F7B9246
MGAVAMMAGKLDRRITFVVKAPGTTDGFGDAQMKDYPIGPVWAAVTPVSDGERMRAAQAEAVITHRFQVRYSARVARVGATAQILYEGRTFEIVAPPKEIGRREGLEFSATARADGPAHA